MTDRSTRLPASDSVPGDSVPSNSAAGESRWLTIPNAVSLFRLASTAGLIGLAWTDRPVAFVSLYLLLFFSDWVDGKLANWLDQHTRLGARLDSISDAVMYTALFVGSVLLKGDELWMEAGWWATAIGSYALASLAGYLKFGTWPSYHTLSAKASNYLVIAGVVGLFLSVSIWPLRVAMVGVTLANIESLVITFRLDRPAADVASYFSVGRSGDTDSVDSSSSGVG